MTDRAVFVLNTDAARDYVMHLVRHAPQFTRVELRGAKRSKEQNDRMWAMLTDVMQQKEHCGRTYSTDQWKVLFMHACHQETVEFLPALDNSTFIPYGQRSSNLSVKEMTELIECIAAWGAQNGVKFNDPREPPDSEAA